MPKENLELNTRQYRLHDYLRECHKHSPNSFINKREIVYALKEYYEPNDSESEHNSLAYHRLRNDIRAINSCPTIQKLFISSSKGYKVANESELDRYFHSMLKRAVGTINLIRMMKKKYEKDGQYRITFTATEKDIIETFERVEKVEPIIYDK